MDFRDFAGSWQCDPLVLRLKCRFGIAHWFLTLRANQIIREIETQECCPAGTPRRVFDFPRSFGAQYLVQPCAGCMIPACSVTRFSVTGLY
jgi:hypothetical protein